MSAPRPSRTVLTALTASTMLSTVMLAPAHAEEQVATVAQIQGASHRSPWEGQHVTGVSGVVTAVQRNGFWMQSTRPDSDPATSEGLYVYTRSAPSVRVGQRAEVAGTVSEYRAGGAEENLTITQLVDPQVTATDEPAGLPDPVVVGIDRVAPQQQIYGGDPGDVEAGNAPLEPDTNALDFYESLEGMRTGVRDAVATGPTNSYGELPVVPGEQVRATRTTAGGVAYGSYDRPNAMRVILDDPLLEKPGMPAADTGDVLSGTSVGVLDYSFANYKLLLTETPQLQPAGAARESTSPQGNNQLAVATFNVENLAPSDPASKYERIAAQITRNLRSPDVLALEEIQDNSGSKDDGVTSSSTTMRKLVEAIEAAGGPSYAARWINPQDKADGGQPGGNIRTAFLYRPDRDVEFVDRPGGDASTATQVVGSGRKTALSHSPGRIAPADAAWDDSRKPLVGEFRFRGKTYFVIANHFASKGGDDPLFGRWQQPTRSSEDQRHQQARVVRGFVDDLLAADPGANVLVVGDLNDFEFSTTADILVGEGPTALTDLPRTVPASDRYTYVFDGNSQVLDHILTSPALSVAPPGSHGPAIDYDIVHTNADFHDQDSDHDPQVVRLRARGGK